VRECALHSRNATPSDNGAITNDGRQSGDALDGAAGRCVRYDEGLIQNIKLMFLASIASMIRPPQFGGAASPAHQSNVTAAQNPRTNQRENDAINNDDDIDVPLNLWGARSQLSVENEIINRRAEDDDDAPPTQFNA
jgi:hypothetical protein